MPCWPDFLLRVSTAVSVKPGFFAACAQVAEILDQAFHLGSPRRSRSPLRRFHPPNRSGQLRRARRVMPARMLSSSACGGGIISWAGSVPGVLSKTAIHAKQEGSIDLHVELSPAKKEPRNRTPVSFPTGDASLSRLLLPARAKRVILRLRCCPILPRRRKCRPLGSA